MGIVFIGTIPGNLIDYANIVWLIGKQTRLFGQFPNAVSMGGDVR